MTTVAALLLGGKTLSGREVEILQALADGETAAQTGARLYLAEDTVKHYRKRILGKLEAKNGPHAVALALRQGIVS